jgi:DnaA family protein
MHQLALDVRLADYAVFDSFLVGPNAVAVTTLKLAAKGTGPPIVWIWAPPEAGKSHLLQAGVALAHACGRFTAYLPLALLHHKPPAILDGMGALDLLAIDDVATIAVDAGWERALFRVYEQIVLRGGRLLIAAETPPAGAGFALPDLTSRLAASAVFRLHDLSDAERMLALQRRAQWRGIALPDETARYLLTHVERGAGSLFLLLDRLDRAALVAQKRLTIPFVKSVLDSADPGLSTS